MPGGRIGGQGKLPVRVVWVFIACCIVVAVWNTFPHDPKGFWEELGNKSEQLRGVAVDVGDWLGLDRLSAEDAKTGPADPKRTPAP